MDRTHILVIAVVVAALAVFGLRFMSDSPEELELAALRGGGGPGALSGDPGDRLSERRRLGGAGGQGAGGRLGAGGGSGSERGGFGSGRTGAADSVAGGGSRSLGGTLGSSGSLRGGGASGGAIGGLRGADTARKADLVDSLGSRPPTQSDLDQPLRAENPDDIALKLDTTDDIAEQYGREQDIEKPDDGDDGLKISEQGRIEFPDGGGVNGEAGEISFKIKPEWAGSDQTDNALVQLRQEHEWNNRLELVKNGEFLRFILTPSSGQEADISMRISNWQVDEVHDIKARWKDGIIELVVDNQVVGRQPYTGQFQPKTNAPLFVGADHRGSNYAGAKATFYNFQVSTNPLF